MTYFTTVGDNTMTDHEYIKLIDEALSNALDEIERLELIIQNYEQHNATNILTLACLKRHRESLFISQN